jgi:calmodulin
MSAWLVDAVPFHGALTDAQDDEITKMFALFDVSGDGMISTAELRHVFTSLGQTPTQLELEDLMRRVDVDGSGMISLGEFKEVMATYMAYDLKLEEIQRTFDIFTGPTAEGIIPLIDGQKLSSLLEAIDPSLCITPAEVNAMVASALAASHVSAREENAVDLAGFTSMMQDY